MLFDCPGTLFPSFPLLLVLSSSCPFFLALLARPAALLFLQFVVFSCGKTLTCRQTKVESAFHLVASAAVVVAPVVSPVVVVVGTVAAESWCNLICLFHSCCLLVPIVAAFLFSFCGLSSPLCAVMPACHLPLTSTPPLSGSCTN